jgi:hypothetical protein
LLFLLSVPSSNSMSKMLFFLVLFKKLSIVNNL